jgi:hypothetical protein
MRSEEAIRASASARPSVAALSKKFHHLLDERKIRITTPESRQPEGDSVHSKDRIVGNEISDGVRGVGWFGRNALETMGHLQ